MRLNRIFCMGGICVFVAIVSLLLAGGDVLAQAPLTINYSNLSMSCGASQPLTASGGCSPLYLEPVRRRHAYAQRCYCNLCCAIEQ